MLMLIVYVLSQQVWNVERRMGNDNTSLKAGGLFFSGQNVLASERDIFFSFWGLNF
jgi:hypothetical protein